MGCNSNKSVEPEGQNEDCFRAAFSVDLKQLFEYYRQVANFIKGQPIFSSPSRQLTTAIDNYLEDPLSYNKENFTLRAINATCKLYPSIYHTPSMSRAWVQSVCLSHYRFVVSFPFKKLSFEECYKNYVEFLSLCKLPPKQTVVANKMGDFMWHAHLQDHQNYQLDTIRMLGHVLDHRSDFQENEIRKYMRQTEQLEKQYLRKKQLRIDYNLKYLQRIAVQIDHKQLLSLYSIASEGDYGGIHAHAGLPIPKRKATSN